MRLLQRIEGEMMEASRVWLGEGADAVDPVQAGRDALCRIATVYSHRSHVVRAIHEASYHDREVEGYYRDGGSSTSFRQWPHGCARSGALDGRVSANLRSLRGLWC